MVAEKGVQEEEEETVEEKGKVNLRRHRHHHRPAPLQVGAGTVLEAPYRIALDFAPVTMMVKNLAHA